MLLRCEGSGDKLLSSTLQMQVDDWAAKDQNRILPAMFTMFTG
jgi:hypothetical protein